MRHFLVFLKGMLMGFADVVPGVSGGTVAFVLGIYEAFIGALRSINLRWIYFGIRFVISGFKPEHLERAKREFLTIHWAFLLPLVGGMGVAIVIGSRVIPDLMEAYPAQMRATFLGLVLASIVVPLREFRPVRVSHIALAVGVATLTFFVLGLKTEPPVRWSHAQADTEMSLREFTRLHPSVRSPMGVYCPPSAAENATVQNDAAYDNAALRAAVAPELAAALDAICAEMRAADDDVVATGRIIEAYGLADKTVDPYSNLGVPLGVPILIAKPSLLYVALAGALAICAMVLPGISGSFILLILGAYYFVFASIRGTIAALLGRGDGLEPVLYVGAFIVGVLFGVLTFARVVGYLFERHRLLTLAGLIGLMAGSLRVLWPFQQGALHGGPTQNVLPTASDPVLVCVVLLVAGFGAVISLSKLAAVLDARFANERAPEA